MEEQLRTTFKQCELVDSLEALCGSTSPNLVHIDKHIPNLLALPSSADLSKSRAYREGMIIFQDKASCFPACLLNPMLDEGGTVDACAAPGNKTTHLAALMYDHGNEARMIVHACDRDAVRAQALTQMVETAGASKNVKVHAGQDFLKTNASKSPWNSVTSILLDPSCSGSGMIGRVETLKLTLPQQHSNRSPSNTKKRKVLTLKSEPLPSQTVPEELALEETRSDEFKSRLQALSAFQLSLLLHAFKFPRARKITYSTCSIYSEENEQVVMKALLSDLAKEQSWNILPRSEQVAGLRTWHGRGDLEACTTYIGSGNELNAAKVADACIRCERGKKDGTQGFFLAGFVRDELGKSVLEDEWEGFSDPGEPHIS